MLAILVLSIAAVIAGASEAKTEKSDSPPLPVLERLKTQEFQVVSQVQVSENGNIHNFATIYVRPYYLIVRLHRTIEDWQFDDSDILEVFIMKGEDIITIWTKPPAPS